MTRTFVRTIVVAVAAAAALSAPRLSADQNPDGSKTVYVSVVDESGKPVKDMTAAEFAMREDGKDIQILSAGPAQAPLQVVFLVDTSDSVLQLTQDIRKSVTAFIKELHSVRNDAAIEMMEFGQAAVATTAFSTDDEVLTKALDHMVGKPTANAVMLEAIQQAAKDLSKRPSQRRAVVGFNAEPSRELIGDTSRIKDAFRTSVAQLWSVSLQVSTAALKPGSLPSGRTTDATRNAVLTQLAQQTGGQHEMINSPAAIEGLLKQYADALTYTYEVNYKPASKNGKVIQMGTTRQGVKIHASGFAPQ
jgi:VWFA-related protein